MTGRASRVKSMTGFGQGAAEKDGLRAEVELKGVNHRFLDVKLRLPPEAAGIEAALRARVQETVQRGRIDIAVTLTAARAPEYRVEINRPLVDGYLKAVAALRKEFRLRGSVDLATVVALPGAVSIQPQKAADDGAAAAVVAGALAAALRAYDVMRTQEGERLAADVEARLRAIGEATDTVAAEAAGLPEAYAARLNERVAALTSQAGLDPARLAQEVALLADRVDLTEETVRLRGYVEQALGALRGPSGPVGKTLDFVMQEMNREANTISSKAESLAICQAALRIKSEVEKIREQIQNLE
jgi:uncharacterized protein (TIGR00255 family)